MRLPRFAMAACAAFIITAPASAQDGLALSLVSDSFESPIFVTAPPGDPRLFVVEQGGTVRIVEDGNVLQTPFLDVSDSISAGGERGLLGLAFHPDYATNGRFFVNYTNRNGNTRIVEFAVSGDPDVADPSSGAEILGFSQPAGNHNGGWIEFGPDGYLYIGTGDGGGRNNQFGTGQDPDSLLAKILRIDVDNGDPYAIPPSNPWANGGGAPEAFLWGLRNPWRAAFDDQKIYIADVGQNQYEEISVVRLGLAGGNLGWSIMEGSHCFQSASCDRTNLVLPSYEYSHSEGCSVTGGYVYRGAAIPAISGDYFFSDYCSGWLRSFRWVGGGATDVTEWNVGEIGRVTSFGKDSAGELYITTSDGEVFQIVPE